LQQYFNISATQYTILEKANAGGRLSRTAV